MGWRRHPMRIVKGHPPAVHVALMKIFQRLAAVFAVGLPPTLGSVCSSAEVPTTADPGHVMQLGPGDQISIQVLGQPDATNVYVAADGTISVPLVGSVPVAGISTVEAAARVEKALKNGGYFVDPQVTITMQPRSQVVSVLGEVHAAGRFPITPGTTILDLLAQAGGVKESAAEFGYVLRKDDSGHVSRYPVRLNGLADSKDPLPMATLLGGDSLVVPPAENCYVTGEVTTPGKYYIEPGMTVMQAILHAGGINARGSERRIELKRVGKNGQYQVIHARPDDPIQADDIIHVKESIF
jgi:polysaccharide export outer membrane protein